MSQTERFQETLLKLAIIGESFVNSEAGLGLGPATTAVAAAKPARGKGGRR